MNVYDVVFVLQFLILIGITLTKFFNVLSYDPNRKDENGQPQLAWYDLRMSWILFVSFFIVWFMGLMVWMVDPEELLWHALFKFENLFVIVNVLFLFIELLYYYNSRFGNKESDLVKPFMSNSLFQR